VRCPKLEIPNLYSDVASSCARCVGADPRFALIIVLLAVFILGCGGAEPKIDASSNRLVIDVAENDPVKSSSAGGCKYCVASYQGASELVSPWLESKERHPLQTDQTFVDQQGRTATFQERVDRPTAVLFFFTRCENPLKCSRSVAILGQLQRELQHRQLDAKTQLLLITLEPHVDTPKLLVDFAEQRGISFSHSGVDVLVPERRTYRKFLDEIAVPVGYDGESVNGHDVGLLLFDRAARLVRQYRHSIADSNAIANDLERLVAEFEKDVFR
jgi:cytochrome oxidase Cu insertion factor (SCO1/SenC/PrrC family)